MQEPQTQRRTLAYDTDGNCTEGYVYDSKGNLTQKWTWAYDFNGNCTEKKCYKFKDSIAVPQSVIKYEIEYYE